MFGTDGAVPLHGTHHRVCLPEQRLCRPKLPQLDQLDNDLQTRGNTNAGWRASLPDELRCRSQYCLVEHGSSSCTAQAMVS